MPARRRRPNGSICAASCRLRRRPSKWRPSRRCVRCRDPVYHLIIAYAKHERPTREQVISDAERLLKAIGMEKSQYALAAHKDTDDFHAHVFANRVRLDGRANDLWHERIVRERVCAEIAAERGWDVVVGHNNRDIVQRIERLHELPAEPQRRLSDGAYRRLHERGALPWQESARPYVLDAVDRAHDWSDLHQRLAAHGVVVKLVRRGERVQGLAFAEGLDRSAPGCAASRIDARCALSALERRFGPFTPLRDPVPDIARVRPWSDTVRPTILTAVDAATWWEDLTARLDQHGIIIKVVQLGARVQGLAFAQGRDAAAPGCGASRIDPRCKKAALEQRLGPFPRAGRQHERITEPNVRADPHFRNRGRLRERAEHDARTNRGWRCTRLVPSLTTLGCAPTMPRTATVSLPSATTSLAHNETLPGSASARCGSRKPSAAARTPVAPCGGAPRARGLLAHQLAYWSIDAVVARRRAKEHVAARVRWEATKIVLASERRLAREEKPMDYRSFVTHRARTGDPAARTVLDSLETPTREQQRHAPLNEPQRPTLNEVRARLDVIRGEEEARYKRANVERDGLQRIAQPLCLDDVLAAERQRIREHVADATRTDAERVRLTHLSKEKRSWNPLTKAVAAKAEAELHAHTGPATTRQLPKRCASSTNEGCRR